MKNSAILLAINEHINIGKSKLYWPVSSTTIRLAERGALPNPAKIAAIPAMAYVFTSKSGSPNRTNTLDKPNPNVKPITNPGAKIPPIAPEPKLIPVKRIIKSERINK